MSSVLMHSFKAFQEDYPQLTDTAGDGTKKGVSSDQVEIRVHERRKGLAEEVHAKICYPAVLV